MNPPSLLALDWGTTNLRGYLLDQAGNTLEHLAVAQGVRSISDGKFAEAFQRHFGHWLEQYPDIPVIACGMVGSRHGWCEAPYVPTPANARHLAQRAIRIDQLAGRPFAIIPGVTDSPPGQAPDIMRGEETQLLGALAAQAGISEGVFVLPGTHSKWIKVRNGAIASFRTYMTGEFYAVLRDHSILGKLFPQTPQNTLSGFMQGLAQAQLQHGNLSHLIFSTRTLGLFEQMPPQDLPGYLSGLLIGDEIADGLRWAGSGTITLIGSDELTRLYRQALASRGHSPSIAAENVTAHGLNLLAKEISW